MRLHLGHQSQQDDGKQTVEWIQRVRQKRGAVRIVKERRMPRRLMQLRYRFVGPPQIPDVAEAIAFIGEVVSRELVQLRKSQQIEATEVNEQWNDN